MVGKKAVVGIKDRGTKQVRAEVVDDTTKETLQGFIDTHADPDTKKFTDENTSYASLPNRESVKHSGRSMGGGPSSHQRHGKLLVDAQARLSRHLPPDEPIICGTGWEKATLPKPYRFIG